MLLNLPALRIGGVGYNGIRTDELVKITYYYLYAVQKMGIALQHCVVVEDSVVGIRATQAAGMGVLGYAPPEIEGTLQQIGAQLFQEMRHLSQLLNAL